MNATDLSRVPRWIAAAEKAYWGATASTAGFGLAKYLYLGSTKELKAARSMASFGARIHLNTLKAPFVTPFKMGGTMNVAKATPVFLAAGAAGYAIGATVGTAIAQIAFGDEGARNALDLYSSPSKFINDGLLGMGRNARTILGHYF